MKYILLTSMFQSELEAEVIKNSRGKPIASANNAFQHALLDGFKANIKEDDLLIVNIPNIGAFPTNYTKYWFKGTSSIHFFEPSFLNIIYLKHFYIYNKTKKILQHLLHKYSDCTVLCYDLYGPWLRILDELKQKKTFKSVCIVPDLPGLTGMPETITYRIFSALPKFNAYKHLHAIDGFILMAEKMMERLPINSKKTLIIEGIYKNSRDLKLQNRHNINNKVFKIVYAGALSERNNIRSLITQFITIDNKNIELHLYGAGNMEEFIRNSAKDDVRIKYHGQINRDKLLERLTEADLLINPRKPDLEFASYSFPSKTMEYMASGTPVLMFKIPSLPREYEKYVYLIPAIDDTSIREAIIDIINKSESERAEIGESARNFIYTQKSPCQQVRKIIEFVSNI